MSLFARVRLGALAIVLVSGVMVVLASRHAVASVLPTGFQEQVVFAGLDQPTNIEFAPDQRIFVTEKKGIIKVFPNLADPVPTIVADLSTEVNSEWDRGLLGLALGPDFATDPRLYILYTYDAPPGQSAPYWNDQCPNATDGTCLVTARLSRLKLSGNHVTGSEQVLIRDWCQQFPSHSIGDLHFGPDGALYVSGGEGASFNVTDYGQLGNPVNPCGDPPSAVGGPMAPPSAEGGSLRSQDLQTAADPAGLSGAVLRLDPETGEAMSGNPLSSSSDPNARRIVAYGLRNPFRFAIAPDTGELWIGDVGQNATEEIDRVVSPTAAAHNFGWPCYEGAAKTTTFANQNLTMCQNLYDNGGAADPYFSYPHGAHASASDTCATGGGAVTGVAFYPANGGGYPADYHNALFFADYARNCIWSMKATIANGKAVPDPTQVETFTSQAATPVDLAVGPGGELYYVDLTGGTVRRFRYFNGNQPPTAVISASPTGGTVPLTVHFDGTESSDPDAADAGRLTYAWDLDGDGAVDSTLAQPTFDYQTPGSVTVRLTVTDTLGATGTETLLVTPGNNAPTPVIDTPGAATTWRVGDEITFSGHATDLQDGTLPDNALNWHLRLHHCATPTNCHVHELQEFAGTGGGSFVAPDHAYPSYLDLELTATDSGGLQHSVVRRLDPKTVDLTFASSPAGLNLSVGDLTAKAPFTVTVIQGSSQSISATSPQIVGLTTYTLSSWSDSQAPAHIITAGIDDATYTATFTGTLPTNLALNRPASGSAACNANETPAKAFNGSWTGGTSDKWCSSAASLWLQVDLGSVSSIGTIVIHHSGAGGESTAGNTRAFTVQVSPDATNWVTVVTVSTNTASVTTHPVSTIGRYVRLNVTTATNNGSKVARIYEVQVFAPVAKALPALRNLALNKAATGSTSCNANETPAKAVNGTWTGGGADKWCSSTGPLWLQVDLGSVVAIGSFVIHHASAGGEPASWNTKDYKIEVSANGTTWSTAVTVTANTAGVTTHVVSALGRYVRLAITTPTGNGSTAARIYEFGAFAPQNQALNRAAISSPTCNTSEVAIKAFNGSWTGGLSDKWCSSIAPRWLEVDLGASTRIGAFVIHHAGGGGEAVVANTRDFSIDVSSNGTTWTRAVTVTGNTASVTTHPVTATGRYVRLNVTTPTSGGAAVARIYELEVMGRPA